MNLEAGSTSLLHSLKNSKFRESMTRDDRFLLGLHECKLQNWKGREGALGDVAGGLARSGTKRYGGGEYWGLEKVSSEQASLGEVLAAEQGHAWRLPEVTERGRTAREDGGRGVGAGKPGPPPAPGPLPGCVPGPGSWPCSAVPACAPGVGQQENRVCTVYRSHRLNFPEDMALREQGGVETIWPHRVRSRSPGRTPRERQTRQVDTAICWSYGASDESPIDLRGPGRACIVPFLEFFKSESSLAVNGALFTEAGPAKGRGPAIVRPGCGPLECAGMLARVAQPQSGAFVCKHQQIGPPINNDDLTARAGQASGYQDSIL
ncbi:unnamed protein product [Rangifer tarandus platyrhynchus]|uniref:Uncharacterized protein n=1 Tax=Rangifer tarandus platyrhynchus TaxID=3082113 RepID=A0ABN8Z0G0_RANTA|nr:unnamed protein product [Rangifer tarandus platyrhynchus]